MYIGVLTVCMCEGVRPPETGVAELLCCELPCECWELNLGPWKEQLVLFIRFTYFMCLSVLPACMSAHRMYRVPEGF